MLSASQLPRRQDYKSATILIVDAGCHDKVALADMLRCNYYECVLAQSEIDAIDLLRLRTIDLVIISNGVLDPAGLAIVQFVRARYSEMLLPILVSARECTNTYRDYLRGLGVNNCLARPYNREAVIFTVSALINIARTFRQVQSARRDFAFARKQTSVAEVQQADDHRVSRRT